jgi:hypothetical protein
MGALKSNGHYLLLYSWVSKMIDFFHLSMIEGEHYSIHTPLA